MGGSGSAQRSAERAERERQASIARTTSRINEVYDAPAREAQYGDFLSALRERSTTDATRQKDVADRRLRFAMARSGLSGGSAAVDANRTLGEEFTTGLLSAENKAQSAVGDLRSQDEQSRLQLLQMAQSGLDTTTAAQRAGAAIQASAQSARDAATAQGLGDIFGGTADIYRRQEDAAARRKGAAEVQAGLYGASPFGRRT